MYLFIVTGSLLFFLGIGPSSSSFAILIRVNLLRLLVNVS